MANANISKVYLLDVPLENDYKHTLYFNSKSAQNTYFLSKKITEFSYPDFSYQRKDSIIRVPAHIDTLYKCNYVAYQNTFYSNKWYYAFITDMRYINDGTTEIEIETDVMQTWYFDYTIKPSFVEREHVSDDEIGLHTIPEDLEAGEYVCDGEEMMEDGGFAYVIATTRDRSTYERVGGKLYNGIYSGMRYYVAWTTADIEAFIWQFDHDGYGEDITSIFIIPKTLLENENQEYDPDNPIIEFPQTVGSKVCGSITISRPNKLNGYTPRNNKLLTHPYQYLLVDNSAGNAADFRYEFFLGEEAHFEIHGSVCPGTSRILLPTAYKVGNMSEEGIGMSNLNHGMSLGKFPICNWNTDVYTNWLTQQSVNLSLAEERASLKIASGAVNSLVGIASADAGGNVARGVTDIASGALDFMAIMGQKHEHSFSPMQSKGNVNCGDVITSMHYNMPIFYKMTIREEYARQIDGFFDMFGYKCNLIKIPNKAHRSRYWYTKTVDINIDGAIPMKELAKIKSVYNNGVTFWRNANEIQNYSLSNNIALID